MSEIEFTHEQKQAMAEALQRFLESECDTELGQFDALFLVDFINKELAPAFYNKGVSDAKSTLERRMLDISDDFYSIEKDSKY